MTRDEFMDVVYDELHSDGDNNSGKNNGDLFLIDLCGHYQHI